MYLNGIDHLIDRVQHARWKQVRQQRRRRLYTTRSGRQRDSAESTSRRFGWRWSSLRERKFSSAIRVTKTHEWALVNEPCESVAQWAQVCAGFIVGRCGGEEKRTSVRRLCMFSSLRVNFHFVVRIFEASTPSWEGIWGRRWWMGFGNNQRHQCNFLTSWNQTKVGIAQEKAAHMMKISMGHGQNCTLHTLLLSFRYCFALSQRLPYACIFDDTQPQHNAFRLLVERYSYRHQNSHHRD